MYDLSFVKVINCRNDLNSVELYDVLGKSFLFGEELSKLATFDVLHNKEENVCVLKPKLHFHQVWVIVCLHDGALHLGHFDHIVVEKQRFTDCFDSVELLRFE